MAASLIKYSPPAVLVKDKNASTAAQKAKASSEELLEKIVPTKYFRLENREWVQAVSSDPATKLDVVNLQEQLNLRLQQRHAREIGICPVREEMYSQAFDEVIRQVAVNCAERGVLLLRVRDEIRMTQAALQGLYESSVAFGMRKALMAEQHKAELRARIRILSAEVAELDKASDGLRTRMAEMEAVEAERCTADEARHTVETAKLRTLNEALKEQLDALLSAPGK